MGRRVSDEAPPFPVALADTERRAVIRRWHVAWTMGTVFRADVAFKIAATVRAGTTTFTTKELLMKTKRKPKTTIIHEAPMIHVGATKESVETVLKGVTTILDYDRDPTVLVEALRTFRKATAIRNVTISGSNFSRHPATE